MMTKRKLWVGKLEIILWICLLYCLPLDGRSAAAVGKAVSRSRLFQHLLPTSIAMNNKLVVEEYHAEQDQLLRRFLIESSANTTSKTWTARELSPANLEPSRATSIRTLLRQTFLPIGYPRSVPEEYTAFQCWNLLQDLCSYLRGVMSTRALLQGMGVGRADITAYQATIQWIFRDGASLLGSLLFTSLNSYNFGQNVKMWRLFADSVNNIGLTLDLFAPLLPRGCFLPVLCLGSLCKALCGVAAGATGAVINMHFGQLQHNVAEVLAKNNAQHNVVSLLGLLGSLWFATVADKLPGSFTYTSYAVLTVLHMFSNYRAMKILALTSLNRTRLCLLIEQFLSAGPAVKLFAQWQDVSCKDNTIQSDIEHWLKDHQHMFSPKAVAFKEPILPTWLRRSARSKIRMWSSFSELVSAQDDAKIFPTELIPQLQVGAENSYLIIPKDRKVVDVLMMRGASLQDVAQALFEATMSCQYACEAAQVRAMTKTLFPTFWRECIVNTGWQTLDTAANLLVCPDSKCISVCR